jgi:hypothetical protein
MERFHAPRNARLPFLLSSAPGVEQEKAFDFVKIFPHIFGIVLI